MSPDADADLLTEAEEESLGSDPHQPDEDRNQVLDGVDLAQSVAAEIAALPTQPTHDRPYKEDHLLRGLETCDVCGATVNMGWLVVVTPGAGLYAKVPYIGLHYLEHGGFAYAGNVHGADRADVALLVSALHAKGPSHFKAMAEDADGDGLKDDEEACFHCDPATADTDGDGRLLMRSRPLECYWQERVTSCSIRRFSAGCGTKISAACAAGRSARSWPVSSNH